MVRSLMFLSWTPALKFESAAVVARRARPGRGRGHPGAESRPYPIGAGVSHSRRMGRRGADKNIKV